MPKNAKKRKKPANMGRPSKYDPKIIPDVERLIGIGVSQNDVAYFLQVDPDTLIRWKKKHPTFADAIKRGESKKRVGVLNALYKNAINGNVAAQIFLAKNWCGMTDRQEIVGELQQVLKFEFGSNGFDYENGEGDE